MSLKEILVPDLGGADHVDVIELNVKLGDIVALDQGIVTLESDKATMEVPATSAGTIKEIFVNIGDKLSEGQKVVAIETQEMINKETISSNVLSKNAPSQTNPLSITPTIQGTINPSQDVQQLTKIAEASAINPHYHATPMVRRLASEFGVDLSRVTATGPKGRILKDDIQLYVKQQLVRAQNGGNVGLTLPEMPVVDFSKFGDTETQALSKIKKLTGTNLRRNWLAIPHVTQCDEADITELESYRKGQKSDADARGLKLTPLVFIMKAVVGALKEFPRFNASLSPDSQSLIIKKYFHIGVAVDTPDGLVVPVVRDVDQKDIIRSPKNWVISVKKRVKANYYRKICKEAVSPFLV